MRGAGSLAFPDGAPVRGIHMTASVDDAAYGLFAGLQTGPSRQKATLARGIGRRGFSMPSAAGYPQGVEASAPFAALRAWEEETLGASASLFINPLTRSVSHPLVLPNKLPAEATGQPHRPRQRPFARASSARSSPAPSQLARTWLSQPSGAMPHSARAHAESSAEPARAREHLRAPAAQRGEGDGAELASDARLHSSAPPAQARREGWHPADASAALPVAAADAEAPALASSAQAAQPDAELAQLALPRATLSWARLVRALLAAPASHMGSLRRVRIIRATPVLNGCSPLELTRLAECASERRVARYTCLFRQASLAHGGQLLLLVRGSVRLVGVDGSQETLHGSAEPPAQGAPARAQQAPAVLGVESAASDALSSGRRRPDSCATLSACTFLCLQPAQLPATVRERCRALSNRRLLQERNTSLWVYRDLGEAQLRLVSAMFEFRFVHAGAPVAREGEPADSFAYLVCGKLAMTRAHVDERGVASELLLGRIGTGSESRYCGEQPFLEWLRTGKHAPARRTASVTAEEPSWCARAPRPARLPGSPRAPAPLRRGAANQTADPPADLSLRARCRPLRARLLELPSSRYESLFRAMPAMGELFQNTREYYRRSSQLVEEERRELSVRRMLKRHQQEVAERKIVFAQIRDARILSAGALSRQEKQAARAATRQATSAATRAASLGVDEWESADAAAA